MHIPWQAALAMVFYTGNFVSCDLPDRHTAEGYRGVSGILKKIVGAGIGLFIAFLGLKNAGIIAANPRSIVGLGNVSSPSVLLGLAGIVLTIILVARKCQEP